MGLTTKVHHKVLCGRNQRISGLKNSMERKLKFGLCSCFFVCSLKGFLSWPFGYQKGKNRAENKKKDLKCGKWSTINEKKI